MRRLKFLLIAIVLLSARSVHASCIPSFAYADGWLGGDRAYSNPLDAGRGFWLFGDSFVGAQQPGSRARSRMIYNAAAISTCPAGS
jgi:hypothetical protein